MGANMFAHTQFESFSVVFPSLLYSPSLIYFLYCTNHHSAASCQFWYGPKPASSSSSYKSEPNSQPGCMLNRFKLPSLPFPPVCAILRQVCAYSVPPHDCPLVLAVLLIVVWRIILPLTDSCPIIRKLAVTVRVWIIILPFLPKTYLHS